MHNEAFELFHFFELALTYFAGHLARLYVPDGTSPHHVYAVYGFHAAAVAGALGFCLGRTLRPFGLPLGVLRLSHFLASRGCLLVEGGSLFVGYLAVECTARHGICHRPHGIGEHPLAVLRCLGRRRRLRHNGTLRFRGRLRHPRSLGTHGRLGRRSLERVRTLRLFGALWLSRHMQMLVNGLSAFHTEFHGRLQCCAAFLTICHNECRVIYSKAITIVLFCGASSHFANP